MPKPDWSRRWRALILCCLALLLVGLLGGCGPRAPKPIVQQALAYQLSHLSAPVGSLVGSDQLPTRLELQDVKIRQDRRESLLLACCSATLARTGEKLEGHHLSGTYTLNVKLPGARRPYRRKGDPFQLTLVHQKAQTVTTQGPPDQEPDRVGETEPKTLPERWLLAYRSPDSKTWEVIDFLPQPTPLPELPPAETADLESTVPPTAPATDPVFPPAPRGNSEVEPNEVLNEPSPATPT